MQFPVSTSQTRIDVSRDPLTTWMPSNYNKHEVLEAEASSSPTSADLTQNGEGNRQHVRPEQRANWGQLEGKLMCMPARQSVDRVSKTLLSEILKKKETKQTAQEFKQEADTTSHRKQSTQNEQHYFPISQTQLEAYTPCF